MAYPDQHRKYFQDFLQALESKGIFKEERLIHSPQDSLIRVEYPGGSEPNMVINMCANNYLGLSSHPDILAAAHEGLDRWGYGMSSVRFICGTQSIHKQLEAKITGWLGTEDTLLFPSCLDANAGVFEAILGEEDVMIADRLVHASIVDGMRLARAEIDTFKHSQMDHLEKKLILHQGKRLKLIITDGVFSMDGDLARLNEIVDLAQKYQALVFVDDSHGSGVMGGRGRGTHEHFNVMGKIDVITTTFGKALGGAAGGCVSGRREIVEMCRQRARPYLFSNSLPPLVAHTACRVLDLLIQDPGRLEKLRKNTDFWRRSLAKAGFILQPGDSPIIPVMLFNARLSQDFARALYKEGVYAVGFFFPVVPRGKARIRTQISAAHEHHHLEKALEAFIKVGKKMEILDQSREAIIARYGDQ